MILAPEFIKRLLSFKSREILILFDHLDTLWSGLSDTINKSFEYAILLPIWIIPDGDANYDRLNTVFCENFGKLFKKRSLIQHTKRDGYTNF